MGRKQKEKAITEAAAKEFRYKGFGQTRMATIANNADLSYGLLCHYFGDKEKLFNAIIDDWWEDFYASVMSTLICRNI